MDTPNQASRTLFERISNHRLSATFALLTVLSGGILIGSVLTRSVSGKEQQVDSSDARPLVVPSPVMQSNEFSKIAKTVGPAVVNINTVTLPKQSTTKGRSRTFRNQPNPNGDDSQGGDQGDMQDFLNRFFGGQGGQDDGANGGGGEREALGSGFIVDSRGYIVTNNHVVEKADKIYVKLSTDPENGTERGRPAHVIGVDPDTDIAVIKIDAPQPAAHHQTRQLRRRAGRRLGARHRKPVLPV